MVVYTAIQTGVEEGMVREMKHTRILVVEDDANILRLVQYNLEREGYEVLCTESGEQAIKQLAKIKPDFIVLDLMLPGIDGVSVCKQIRKEPHVRNVPILMLTAKGEEIDRIVGLEAGADDYLVKPFSPRELILRIKAILKRQGNGIEAGEKEDEILRYGKITVDIGKHVVMLDKKEIELTPIEFKLLVLFIRRQGRVQQRDVLLSDVWNIESDITTRTVDTHVKRLRQKLGKAGDAIKTVRGLGYKMMTKE